MFHHPTSDTFGKTLSQLWLFAILNILFRDVHELTTASALNELLGGTLNGNPVTETALLGGAFAVEILLLAMLGSALLRPRFARIVNLIAPPLALAGMLIVPPADPDDYVFAAVVSMTLVAIFTLAFRWQNNPQPTQQVRHAV